jgi:hypothetical protein
MNPIMFDKIDLLWLIALDDIRSAQGDSSAFDAFIVRVAPLAVASAS